jgi:hypothetical protein
MDEAEAIVIDDTSDVAIAVKSQQSSLPDGWKKLPTDKKHKKNNPDTPNFYYFNTLTSGKTMAPAHASPSRTGVPLPISARGNRRCF